ncbi:hypothetical protein M0R04_15025 [Candidatus Dojkabacteria bacterium]|jgi:hypothetical protein|nr:hypothetical protein [Candidatus Dojkabacteria bacterium]
MNTAYIKFQIKAIDEALIALSIVNPIVTGDILYQIAQNGTKKAILELETSKLILQRLVDQYDTE